jgi:hypothetical protein
MRIENSSARTCIESQKMGSMRFGIFGSLLLLRG